MAYLNFAAAAYHRSGGGRVRQSGHAPDDNSPRLHLKLLSQVGGGVRLVRA